MKPRKRVALARRRHARNDRGPEIAQEHQDAHHHQTNREHQRELHVADRGTDRRGAIRHAGEFYTARHRGLTPRQFFRDQLDGLDDVGIRRALDGEDDGGRLVIPGGELIVGGANRGMTDIADADRCAVAIGDDRVVMVRHLRDLVIGLQGVGLGCPSNMPFGSSTVMSESAVHTSSSV